MPQINLIVTVSNDMSERVLQELIHAMELWKYVRSVEVAQTPPNTASPALAPAVALESIVVSGASQ
jgi:hypothetical protein